MDYNETGQNPPAPPEPPYQQAPQFQRPEPHRGALILIFGIIGLFTCAIFSVLAWIFGNEDLKKMDSGRMDPAGRDNTNAGRILGIIGVAFNLLGLLISLAWIVFILGAGLAGAAGIFGG
ncbi:MAG: hypothetical protein PHD87_06390 [Candidatus Cloacimonetes bacterium]|nr:hypothetical protein [Candidatus Cloacimonadota bacterium]